MFGVVYLYPLISWKTSVFLVVGHSLLVSIMLPKCLLIAIAALAITSVARPVDGNQALDNGGDLARRASGHYDTYSAAIEASTAVAVVEAREGMFFAAYFYSLSR